MKTTTTSNAKHVLAAFVLTALTGSIVAADFTTTACFTVEGEPVSGAVVKCWDQDWGSDDVVGDSNGVLTDSTGCASIEDTGSWWEDPDVYCRIYPNGACFAEYSTGVVETDSDVDVDLGYHDLSYDDAYCGDFGADANGCGPESFPTWLNDVATSVSGFDSQCSAHDACYADCTKTRSYCDIEFEFDMYATCAGGWTCQILADLFYQAVSDHGQAACESARLGSCGSVANCSH